MQQDHDRRLATKLQELWEREVEIAKAIEHWNETVPCDVHTAGNGGKHEDCEKCQKFRA